MHFIELERIAVDIDGQYSSKDLMSETSLITKNEQIC